MEKRSRAHRFAARPSSAYIDNPEIELAAFDDPRARVRAAVLRRFPTTAWAFGSAVAFTAAALLLTGIFLDAMERSLYMFAYAAVAVSAWYAGRGPALLTSVLMIVGVQLVFIAPSYRITDLGLEDALRIGVFVLVSLLIGSMNTNLRVALERSESARAVAERRAAALALSAEASATLASSLDYEETLRNVARAAVPDFAAWCGVDLVDDAGELRRVAVEHADPAKVQLARDLQNRYPPRKDAPVGGYHVLRTGATDRLEVTDEMLRAAAMDEEHLRIMRELRLGSAVVAPLRARERVLGVLSFVREAGSPPFSTEEANIAEDLARRAALSIENAQLLRQSEEARRVLEEQAAELEAQTEEMQAITEELEVTAADLQSSNEALREERDAAQEARTVAEHANRAKSQFLATMSHELRTPLNAITGYAELINLGVHGPVSEQQQQAIGRIDRNSRHLLGLINSILNFAKLEAGQVTMRQERVPLHATLASMEALIEPQLQAKELNYTYAPCDNTLAVTADAEKTEQILLNLLSNAIKFTEPGGSVTVTCEPDGDNVRVHVHDTGRGIPPDKLDAVFEPFVQVDPSRTVGQEGVGLGLAISRDLARGMKGDLTATSEEGKGSTFTLTLPRAAAMA